MKEFEFFSESDCDIPPKGYIDTLIGFGIVDSGYIKIDKANRLLRERAKVVTAHQTSIDYGAWYENDSEPNPTHQALLIAIEPIQVDSAKKIVEDFLKQVDQPYVQLGELTKQLIDRAKKLARGEK